MSSQGTLRHYVHNEGQTLHVEIHDDFCFSMLREFRRVCERRRYAHYIIDLANTTFIDSAALGMLMVLHHFVNEDRRAITIVNASETVRQVLLIAHFNRFFDIPGLQAAPLPD